MSTLLNGLWAAYEFDNAAGEVALDSHDQSLDLVDVNTVQRVPGLLGNAAFFEAANNEYFSSDDALLSLANIGNDFTISFWGRGFGAITGTNVPVRKSGSTNADRVMLVLTRLIGGVPRADFRLYYNDSGGVDAVWTDTGLFGADFDLVTVWRDDAAGTINVQVNNGTVYSVAVSGPPNTSITQPLEIVKSETDDTTLDNLWIWNRVLTPAERTEFYNAGAGITYASIAATPPDAPSALTATAIASHKIRLGWTDNSDDETGFKVERSLTGTGGWTLVQTTAADATTYTDTGLTPGIEYFYRVAATNAEGDSAYTATASATTLSGTPTVVLTSLAPTVELTDLRPTVELTSLDPTVELTML